MSSLLILAVVALLIAAIAWLLLVGDRADAMVDEPPTLDTRNHLDDPDG